MVPIIERIRFVVAQWRANGLTNHCQGLVSPLDHLF